MRIETARPKPGETVRQPDVIIEPGDRIALLDIAHEVVGDPKTVPASGPLEWNEIRKCETFWWAPLDENDKPVGLFGPERWSPGITYTLLTQR